MSMLIQTQCLVSSSIDLFLTYKNNIKPISCRYWFPTHSAWSRLIYTFHKQNPSPIILRIVWKPIRYKEFWFEHHTIFWISVHHIKMEMDKMVNGSNFQVTMIIFYTKHTLEKSLSKYMYHDTKQKTIIEFWCCH